MNLWVAFFFNWKIVILQYCVSLCHTWTWSSHRYTNVPFLLNQERWYWWIYLQGSSGHTDIENGLLDAVGEGEGGTNWESSRETYTLPYVKYVISENLLCDIRSWPSALWLPRGVDGVGAPRDFVTMTSATLNSCATSVFATCASVLTEWNPWSETDGYQGRYILGSWLICQKPVLSKG